MNLTVLLTKKTVYVETGNRTLKQKKKISLFVRRQTDHQLRDFRYLTFSSRLFFHSNDFKKLREVSMLTFEGEVRTDFSLRALAASSANISIGGAFDKFKNSDTKLEENRYKWRSDRLPSNSMGSFNRYQWNTGRYGWTVGTCVSFTVCTDGEMDEKTIVFHNYWRAVCMWTTFK